MKRGEIKIKRENSSHLFGNLQSNMATDDDNWMKLKTIMVGWIIHHAELNIDLSLASWLDTSGTLLRSYQVF